MRVLCFDIGGTAIKYGMFEDENIPEVDNIPTRVDETNNYIIEDISKIIDEYENIDAIGISTAGVVDHINGSIIFAGPTIPKYTGTKIKEIIENKYNVPCFVENDVNSAAYGEYIYSKLDGVVACITIGTGVGGGFILNDEIYRGYSNTAGELGYMTFKDGYFQDYVSTSCLVRNASKRLDKKVNGLYVFEEAKKGNKICNEVIDEFIEDLIHGLLNIVYLMNPNTIVIGGGITAQGDYLERKIINKLEEKIISKQFKTNIRLAKLANTAGLYGIFNIVRKERDEI